MTQANEVFVGRLGKKPELKYTQKQEPICYLSVAINKTDSETPDWKQVVVWGRQAEQCNLFLKKGNEVFVQGRINEREYTDREGKKQIFKEIKAKLIGFINL